MQATTATVRRLGGGLALLLLGAGCQPTAKPGITGSAAGATAPVTTGASVSAVASADWVVLVEPALEVAIQPLVDARRREGLATAVVTLDRVAAPGRTRAETLRNWLIAARAGAAAPGDLLLVGSPAAIPWVACQVAPGKPPVVSDLWYGDLRGDWDADGDGVLGERGDDRVQFESGLRVGRIPYGAPAEVQQAVEAILRAGRSGEAWQDGALLVAGNILAPGDAAQGVELLRQGLFLPRGWSTATAYPRSAGLPASVEATAPAILAELQRQPRALAWFFCHGSPDELVSAEAGGAVRLLAAADLPQLPRDRPPVLVAAACDAGAPGPGARLGQDALRLGAAGFLGATVVVDPTSGGGAGLSALQRLGEELAGGASLGRALAGARSAYLAQALAGPRSAAELDEVHQEALGAILYGDPALRLGPRAP